MHHLRAIALLTFLPLAIFLTPKLSLVVENSLLFMPLEFKTLKKTFEELASANIFMDKRNFKWYAMIAVGIVLWYLAERSLY